MSKLFYVFAVLAISVISNVRADNGEDDILPPMITVQGSGEVDVDPTEALVSIGIELHDQNLTALRLQVDQTASNMIAFLQKNGVESKDIQTSYITLTPHYPDSTVTTGNTNPDYYIADKSMTYLLKNLSNYDPIMTGLYDLGLNTVDGITFKVANDSTYEIEAKQRAVENAQATAQAMADALGVQLGNVYSVTDNSYVTPVTLMAPVAFAENDAEASSSSSGPSISSGQIQYTSSITVAYYIIQ